jgi:hypothetical protein
MNTTEKAVLYSVTALSLFTFGMLYRKSRTISNLLQQQDLYSYRTEIYEHTYNPAMFLTKI